MALLIKKLPISSFGFTLVEVLIALLLLSVLTLGGMAANSLVSGSVVINQKRAQANFLAREAMEAVLSARAADFTALTPGEFHPVLSAAGWSLAPGEETIGEFTRKVTLSNVMREISCQSAVCDIVQAGGVVDEGTLKAQVEITWQETGTAKSYRLGGLISYWR